MCPRNPVTWETHAYFSHLRRFTGRTDSHYVHINKLEFFFFVYMNVCVSPPPSSPPNITDCFLPSPSQPAVVVRVSPGGLEGGFSLACSWTCRNPLLPPHKLQFCHRYINANIPSDPCQKPHKHPAECVASSPLKSQRETATSYRINFISKLRLK